MHTQELVAFTDRPAVRRGENMSMKFVIARINTHNSAAPYRHIMQFCAVAVVLRHMVIDVVHVREGLAQRGLGHRELSNFRLRFIVRAHQSMRQRGPHNRASGVHADRPIGQHARSTARYDGHARTPTHNAGGHAHCRAHV